MENLEESIQSTLINPEGHVEWGYKVSFHRNFSFFHNTTIRFAEISRLERPRARVSNMCFVPRVRSLRIKRRSLIMRMYTLLSNVYSTLVRSANSTVDTTGDANRIRLISGKRAWSGEFCRLLQNWIEKKIGFVISAPANGETFAFAIAPLLILRSYFRRFLKDVVGIILIKLLCSWW